MLKKKNKKQGSLTLEKLEKLAEKLERKSRNKKVSFTHNEFKKLVVEWDKGHALMPFEEKAIFNHLAECENCMRMLSRRHVNVEVIKK